MSPYRTPAHMPPEHLRVFEWDDAALLLLEQSRRAQEEARDFYLFLDALPAWWRLALGWLTLA